MSMAIGLAALYLGLGVAAGAQVSNPAGTIQGAKKQTQQATSGQQAQTPAKSQAASAPVGQVSSPAKKSAAAPVKSPAKSPATPTAGAPAKAPAKTQAAAPAKTPAKAPAKAPAQAAAKAAPGKAPAKAPAKAAEAKAKAKPAAAEAPKVARRDPFSPLVSKQRTGGPPTEHLPPGKAGLVIATLRLQGIVRGPNGMIAIVANPQQSVYFLREGDQLYDGRVLHISMESVAFHESGKDAFGKPVEREVSKRLYPSAGEQ
jgi:Tfp pilus assembly protein PilP